MRLILTLLIIGLFAISQSGQAATPDICVYETLKVATLRGKVVYGPSQAGTESAKGATVELRRAGYNGSVVKKVVADDDGGFDFGRVKDGEYVIYVEAPQKISSIYFPVELKNARELKEDEPKLQVTLGFGYKGCRGSFAQYGKLRNFSP